MPDKSTIESWFKGLQDRICHSLEVADGKGKFVQDLWDREDGGGGRTRIIQGDKIEKGGVNFSAVWGNLPEKIAKAYNVSDATFYASGVSIVLHPKNPHVPIIHMNVRYFEMSTGVWWFGGGIDLTPHYIVEEQGQFFHNSLKEACDKHHDSYYPKFKKWADNYFYIPHRKETRGIGGIFFDQLSEKDGFSKEQRFDFVKEVGNAFSPIYTHLLAANENQPFTEAEQDWQFHRRGRYVEFNLVWDRGTKFGLETNGRTESILMSLPAMAKWSYNHEPLPGSPEFLTQKLLRKGIDWAK